MGKASTLLRALPLPRILPHALPLAVLGALLAGCSGPAAGIGPPGTPDAPPGLHGAGAESASLEMVGCQAHFLEYWTDASRLDPFLPEGYEALPALGPLAGVDVGVYTCRSAVLNGTQVVRGLQWVQVSVGARAPDGVASNETVDEYLFELLVSDPAVQRMLRGQGIDAALGSAAIARSGASTRIAVYRGDLLLYGYEGAADLEQSSIPYLDARRDHQASPGRLSFIDKASRGTLSTDALREEGVLSAHAGFVAQTLLGPGGRSATARWTADLALFLEFSSFPHDTRNGP